MLSGGSHREPYPGEVSPVTEPNHLGFVSNVSTKFVPILKVLEPFCVMKRCANLRHVKGQSCIRTDNAKGYLVRRHATKDLL